MDDNLNHPFEMAESDLLNHDSYARSLLRRISLLRDGATVAICAPWGRGKTDVLARVHRIASHQSDDAESTFAQVIAVNPWRYAQHDLLTPLVLELLSKRDNTRRTSKAAVWKAARTVIAGGMAIGMRATPTLIPGGKLIQSLADDAKEIVDGLLEAVEAQDQPARIDPDPVASLGLRFRELVDAALESNRPTDRVLICIDDMDRCLPGRQVALLEALHFLRAADARAIFLVAVDPSLLRRAVAAHYGSTAFDSDAYIEKIVDYTQDLPPLDSSATQAVVGYWLEQPILAKTGTGSIREWMKDRWGQDGLSVFSQLQQMTWSHDLVNPRVMSRMFYRLRMLTLEDVKPESLELASYETRNRLAIWLAATQRWPETRRALSVDGPSIIEKWIGPEHVRLAAQNPRPSHASPPSYPIPAELYRRFERWPALLTYFEQENRQITYNYPHEWSTIFRDFARFDLVFRNRGL